MIIKVCGMRDPENICKLAELEVDYMGFIFYPQSKRFAGSPDKDILASLPPSIKKTGVFVDESADVILRKITSYQLNAVQLHGSETPEFCMSLQNLIRSAKIDRVELIKAFGISEDFNFNDLEAFSDIADYFLFDTKNAGHGGSGVSFDWKILNRYKLDTPYFLSGGLSMDNITAIGKHTDHRLYGVDLNSRFETEPGIKDIDKLRSVFEIIKN